MYKNRILPGIFFLTAAVLLAGCSGGGAAADTATADPVTPVAITHISSGPVSDTVTLSATSVFLQKNYVKANAIGYIQQVYVKPGQFVHQGQLLFVIKTKEAQSIGNTINVLDTTFKFSGVNRIKASGSGYITQLAHQLGDYVQDGEQLAVISDHNSFAFLMQLPYELHSLIANNKTLALTLPDGTNLRGTIASTMPNVDSLAQTQGLVVKVNSNEAIPENLVARAHLIKSAKAMATTLPKSAVLADESQTEFWVMKLLSDSLAVKVPIKKGIETQTQIEILSPAFKPTDRIITTGNYGLADTAKIKITRP